MDFIYFFFFCYVFGILSTKEPKRLMVRRNHDWGIFIGALGTLIINISLFILHSSFFFSYIHPRTPIFLQYPLG